MLNKYGKGFEIFLDLKIEPISLKENGQAGIFRVISPSGKSYEVSVRSDGVATCTCDAAKYGKLCSHIVAVYYWLGYWNYGREVRKIMHKKIEQQRFLNFVRKMTDNLDMIEMRNILRDEKDEK